MHIIADRREPAGIISALLTEESVHVDVEPLDVGDYLIGPGAIVSRRTGADFAAAMFDGRLADQIAKMKAVYSRVFIVIEGSPYGGHIQFDPRLITSVISRLIVVDEIAVLRTETLAQTIDLILSLASRLQDDHPELPLRPIKPDDPRAVSEFILCGLPHVGRVRARVLLDHFGTARRVFTAEPDEIAAIRGFGPKTAEAIRAALDTPY